MKRYMREQTPVEMLDAFEKRADEVNTPVPIQDSTKIQSSYECQYVVIPWKEEDDLNLSPFLSYHEAVQAGNEYYPEGYDIEEYNPDDYEWFDDESEDITSSIDPSDKVDPRDVANYANEADPVDDWYEDENSAWERLDCKRVLDQDGFWTEYCLYHNTVTGQYVTVFGDSDLYRPEDGYFDMEFDSESEAWEFFEDYPEDPFGGDDDIYGASLIDVRNTPEGRQLIDELEEAQEEIRSRGLSYDDDSEFWVRRYHDAVKKLKNDFGYHWNES